MAIKGGTMSESYGFRKTVPCYWRDMGERLGGSVADPGFVYVTGATVSIT